MKLDVGYRLAAFIFAGPCPTGNAQLVLVRSGGESEVCTEPKISLTPPSLCSVMSREIVLTLEFIPINHIGFSPYIV